VLPFCPGSTSLTCFTATVAGDFDVEVEASDGIDTATAHKLLRVVPGQPPVAKLDLVSPTVKGPMGTGPYPLGSAFRLSSMRSTAPDSSPVVPTFHLSVRPDGSTAEIASCDDPSTGCFTADVSGRYVVDLDVVANGITSSATQELIVDDDALPCIDMSSPERTSAPIPGTVDMNTDFQVLHVTDDLDEYPKMNAIFDATPFNWFVIEAGGAPVLRKADSPTFRIFANERRLGDVIKVRLEIRDRQTTRSAAHFAACNNADTCMTTEGCYQRWTWTVRY
jgi:hypothetical protein